MEASEFKLAPGPQFSFFYSVIRDNPRFAGINEGTPSTRARPYGNANKTQKAAPNHPLTLTSSADNSAGQPAGVSRMTL